LVIKVMVCSPALAMAIFSAVCVMKFSHPELAVMPIVATSLLSIFKVTLSAFHCVSPAARRKVKLYRAAMAAFALNSI